MNFDFSKLLSFLSSGFTKDEDNIDKSYFPPSSSHPSSRTIVTVSSLQFPGCQSDNYLGPGAVSQAQGRKPPVTASHSQTGSGSDSPCLQSVTNYSLYYCIYLFMSRECDTLRHLIPRVSVLNKNAAFYPSSHVCLNITNRVR